MTRQPLADTSEVDLLPQAALDLRAAASLNELISHANRALPSCSVAYWRASGELVASRQGEESVLPAIDPAFAGGLLHGEARVLSKGEPEFEETAKCLGVRANAALVLYPVATPGVLVAGVNEASLTSEQELFLQLLAARIECVELQDKKPPAASPGNPEGIHRSHLMLTDEALRDIFYFAPTAMLLSDGKTAHAIAANRHAVTLFGIPEAEASELRTSDYWLDLSEREEFIRQVMMSGFVRGYRAQLRRADGSHFWARISSTRIDYRGQAVIMSSVTDVSDAVAMEEVLHRTQQTLNTLLEASPFPLVVTRLDTGVVRYCNRKAAEMFEISPAGLIGHTAPEFYVDPSDRTWFLEQLRTTGAVEGFVAQLKTGEGEAFWAILNARTLDLNGEPVFMVAFADVTRQKNKEAQLETLAFKDGLTEIHNRRYFTEAVKSELARSARTGRPLALAMLDIDHFKRINDAWGHEAGDRVLCEFVQVVQGLLRKSDVLARYGGEEFMVLLPETGAEDALAILERIREVVSHHAFGSPGGDVCVTFSAGLASSNGNEDCRQLVIQADAALYEAKRDGRNRVVHLD